MPVANATPARARMALVAGALGMLATAAVHLEEYTANQFSTIPTIGTLFLLNFVAASVVGVGLLPRSSQRSPRKQSQWQRSPATSS